jgi:hypothetical protein
MARTAAPRRAPPPQSTTMPTRRTPKAKSAATKPLVVDLERYVQARFPKAAARQRAGLGEPGEPGASDGG